MIPALTSLDSPKSGTGSQQFPPGAGGGGRTTVRGEEIHYRVQASGNTQVLRAYCIIQRC